MGNYAAIVGAVTGRAAGFMSKQATDREARAVKKQGAAQLEESREESARARIEGRKFEARQKLAFLKSGVSLEGSPLLALQETEAEVKRQADAIDQGGRSRFVLARGRARNLRARGHAALLSSTANTATNVSQTNFSGRSNSNQSPTFTNTQPNNAGGRSQSFRS